MLNNTLINPKSIAIIGASNHLNKPGGQLVFNLKQSGFSGKIYPVNPKEDEVQGIPNFRFLEDVPPTDLAILAIPAINCAETIELFALEKNTRSFIIISGGFGETGSQGRLLEEKIKKLCSLYNLTLIGPNCIGVLNANIHALFVAPPVLKDSEGVDFVSASGALAVFLLEQASMQGLRLQSIYTVGNSIQTGVEEVLEYWDKTWDAHSPKTKMVYVEQIKHPQKFYQHVASLVVKGCRVIICKPGESEAGARATLSHTGAMAGNNLGENLLIERSGAIRCLGRDEMIQTALISQTQHPAGKRAGILTHAGGPAVLLTDQLQKEGFEIPEFSKHTQHKLSEILNPGASFLNPADMLATANKSQLTAALHCLDHEISIDLICLIYGNNGMETLQDTYQALAKCLPTINKPVYVIMPSVNTAHKAMQSFVNNGYHFFTHEVNFAKSLGNIHRASKPALAPLLPTPSSPQNVPLPETEVIGLLNQFKIPYVAYEVLENKNEVYRCGELHFPMVAKATGVLHKTEIGAVITRIEHKLDLEYAVNELLQIENCQRVLVQEMLKGTELFIGALSHPGIGFSVHFGLGGTMVEILNDRVNALAPLTPTDVLNKLSKLKAYRLFEGYRNIPAIDNMEFARIVVALCNLLAAHPNIKEVDLNPLIANGKSIKVVDARIIV